MSRPLLAYSPPPAPGVPRPPRWRATSGTASVRCAAALALALACACAPRAVARRTQPDLSMSSWHSPNRPLRRVLVVSPGSMKKLWADLGPEAEPVFATDARGDPAVVAVERVLFDAGWEPAPETTVRRMLLALPLAIPLTDSMARGQLWLENMVDDSPTLDGVVLLRGWDIHWSERPAAEISGSGIYPLVAELQVELHDKAGRLVWYGHAITQSTDLKEIRATSSKQGVRLSDSALACLGETGSECKATISPAARDRMASHVASVLLEKVAAR